MKKLGLHIQAWSNQVVEDVRRIRPRVLKTMDPSLDPLEACLESGTVVVFRKYFDDGTQRRLLDAREAGGRECAEAVWRDFFGAASYAKALGCPVYFEGLNEIGLWNDADAYNAFTVGFCGRVAEFGYRPAVYSFACGNPPGYKDGSPEDLRAYWAHYVEGLRAAAATGGALALHEYDAPTMRRLETWLCLRYRRVYDILPDDLKELPLLLTEVGIDGGVIGASSAAVAGWRNYATVQEYHDDLAWYDGELSRDSQAIGATVFGEGPDFMWRSFDITGEDGILDTRQEGDPMSLTVLVNLDPFVSEARPGDTVTVNGSISPADEQSKITVFLHYPPKDDDTAYATDPYAFVSGVDGRFSANLQIANFDLDHPITVTARASAVVLSRSGEFGGNEDTATLVVAPYAAQSAPQNPLPNVPTDNGTTQESSLPRLHTKEEEIAHIQQIIFDAAGDGFNASGDPAFLEFQKAIDMMKRAVPFTFARSS